ncbi:hypothetical protein DL764_001929 [Monosporascus ibericus]|uniref:Uncharacterized protein n=1 Tax=Monosporascus ibericus TaxID=155417 RepID=A0A4Q4TRX4_9PEZI|nr:hypothetical protein DL764_001929 [Monosporascus ibericus]
MSDRNVVWPSGLPNPLPGTGTVLIDDPRLRERLCLDWSDDDKAQFFSRMKVVLVEPHVEEKAIQKVWVIEATPDQGQFYAWVEHRERKDKRTIPINAYPMGEKG